MVTKHNQNLQKVKTPKDQMASLNCGINNWITVYVYTINWEKVLVHGFANCLHNSAAIGHVPIVLDVAFTEELTGKQFGGAELGLEILEGALFDCTLCTAE